MKFRKKPVVIEAFQMTEARRADNADWPQWLHIAWNGEHIFPEKFPHSDGTDKLVIRTLEGSMKVEWGDWIIKGVNGELYPCKPDIFAKTYEDAANEPADFLKELEEMKARKDAAYLERNQVVAALATAYPSGTARTAIEGWHESWHGCVYIDLPTGQASWHYHDSQAHLFGHLPKYSKPFDGHTTQEKYARLSALRPENHAAAKLRKALVGLVGAEDPKELEGMASVLRHAPIPDVDKVATINAINVLMETQTV